MGKNQAPARQLFTEFRAQAFPWLATPNRRRLKNLFYRIGQNVAVARGLGPPDLTNYPGGPRLGHHKPHLPSHFLCGFARELQTKTKRDLSRNIYTRMAQPARLPGELTIAPSFDVHLFGSLHYWGVSTWLLDLTCRVFPSSTDARSGGYPPHSPRPLRRLKFSGRLSLLESRAVQRPKCRNTTFVAKKYLFKGPPAGQAVRQIKKKTREKYEVRALPSPCG
jgi:hypothetical protein